MIEAQAMKFTRRKCHDSDESFTIVFGIAALLAIIVACGGEKTDEPAAADTAGLPLAPSSGVVSSGEAIEEPVDDEVVAVASGSMLIPRARNATELVDRSQIIVIGTITSVLAQTEFGGYGEDGDGEAVDGGAPITDYDVSIEMLMKGDGTIVEGGQPRVAYVRAPRWPERRNYVERIHTT
jgi:hypothetical protein